MKPVEILMVVSVLLNGCLIVLCIALWAAFREAERLLARAAAVNRKLQEMYEKHLVSEISFIPDFSVKTKKDEDEGQKH